ncbi:MAG: galactose-1-phosphate uridylyltransferase [Candidatus Berkelbacteria bacterium]|nr:galactose-1-phosphate uridylyltransferase [Candidatus Berkelbacteria bacterium]
MPKLRQNPITGDWVIIAPERAKRPDDYILPKPVPKKKTLEFCNFCQSGEAYQQKIPGAGTKHIYVVDNKYPAFVKDEAITLDTGKIYYSQKSIGGHEVISFVDHDTDIETVPTSYIDELFEVYQKRINFYNQDPVIEYVMPIHNHGAEAGESIEHPHSQLFASCVKPNNIVKELEGSEKFYHHEKKCIFCEIVKEEIRSGQRMIAENSEFVCFCAYASRAPFEMWILPKKHDVYFEKITAETRKKFADIFHEALKRLHRGLNDPPLNFYIHNSPRKDNFHEESFHWHMEIMPRLTRFGGYELGSGIIIDVVSPERSAEFLRKVKV